MAVYNLYLDESTTFTSVNGKNEKKFISISGIIVEKEYHDSYLTDKINDLKNKLFGKTNIILHEKDIKAAEKSPKKLPLNLIPDYSYFQNKNNVKQFYIELEKIISHSDIWIMGACIDEDGLNKRFSRDIQTDTSSIMLQLIFENFCHFLQERSATGNIIYESIGATQDKAMSLKFHHIKSIGTMYIQPYAFQQLIEKIEFPKKSDNVTGLQLADFIPNNIARFHAKKPKSPYNLYSVINKKMYDGDVLPKEKNKYGVKLLP